MSSCPGEVLSALPPSPGLRGQQEGEKPQKDLGIRRDGHFRSTRGRRRDSRMAEKRGSRESPRAHGSKDKVRGMQSHLGPRPGDKWPSDSLVDTPVGRRHRTDTSQAPAPWRSRGRNPGRRVPAERMDAPMWRTPDCLKGAGPGIFFFFPLRNAVTRLLICCQMFKQLNSPGALFP